MTHSGDNLVLEILKSLRNEIRDFRSHMEQGMGSLNMRMGSLENSMILIKREITHGDEVSARQQVSLDRVVNRIERIEHRLELN